eukprot:scaffold157113_cov43-Tisochrysis_lutea.AAC.2
MHPALGPLERLKGCNVVCHDRRLGAPVVHGRERLVALGASGVPDAKLNPVGRVEGRAYCGRVLCVELVLHEAVDERALAHIGVSELRVQKNVGKVGWVRRLTAGVRSPSAARRRVLTRTSLHSVTRPPAGGI